MGVDQSRGLVARSQGAPDFSGAQRLLRNAFLSVTILVACLAAFALICAGDGSRPVDRISGCQVGIETSMRYSGPFTSFRVRVHGDVEEDAGARPYKLYAGLGAVFCVGWGFTRGMDEYLARLLFFAYFIADFATRPSTRRVPPSEE